MESLSIKTKNHCLILEFTSRAGEIISCTKALPIQYTERDCTSNNLKERAETEAVVSCPDPRRIDIFFKTTSSLIKTSLNVQRKPDGRSGIKINYKVESSSEEHSSLFNQLPDPTIKPLDHSTPEESPLKFKFSGFAWAEFEHTGRFGYDGGTDAIPNFNLSANGNEQTVGSFFTNVSFDIGRDRTSLVSTFEIGEIYFGDTTSGGGQGARATNIFEVRNLFLNHELSDKYTLKAGVITTASDPRSFIFNDHIATIQASFKTDLSEGLLWYGNASMNRPGATTVKDQYFGILSSMPISSTFKASLFGIYRGKANEQLAVDDGTSISVAAGDSAYYWYGTTLDYDFNPFTLQLTGIGNSVQTKLPTLNDKYTGYLLDAKFNYSWGAPQAYFSLEALATSGAKNAVDSTSGKAIAGKRKAFVSPVAAAYLMTIATSDGVDDAAGSPKESIIGNLNLDEGLRMLVLSSSVNLSKKTSLISRFGYLAAGNASSANNSTHLGDELDLSVVHQLTPSTLLQVDAAEFYPGKFYTNEGSAFLLATKLKYNF